MKLQIVQLEEIKNLLMKVSGLINRYEKRVQSFSVEVKLWLTEAEEILSNNRLAVTADVAVLRGVLISAERGLIPEGISFHGRLTSRKLKDATAADVLRKAEEFIKNTIRPDTTQLDEGERLANQLIVLAQRKGLIARHLTGGHTKALNAIWNALDSDPELGNVTAHLTGIVGLQNALILIDRLLPN